MSNYWSKYKAEVKKNMASYGSLTKTVLLFGLTTEVGDLLQCTSQEICVGTPAVEERISALGDILWYIASLEIHFNLPNSIYSNYIGTPMTINPNHGLDLIGLHTDLMGYLSEISEAMLRTNLDDLQFNLNKFLYAIYNVFIYYNMNPLGVLKRSMDHMLNQDNDGKPDYEAEYENDRKAIAAINYEEILIDIKLDKRRKNPFVGVIMKAYGEELMFNSGDIIADFFSATNTLYDKHSDKEHTIIYSPKLREYLEVDQPNVQSGFIIGKRVVSLNAILKSATLENGSVRIDSSARPVLMFNQITKLNDLLDYVNDARRDTK